ncbi:flagellar motor switch protein FliG [Colwellia sp. 4_MG-2023]|jgi:flagellar motor switch protein FliG|uniref:flagellar motor switch protein FliG n=1 Tax=unclassified Colwellia TaxID=196834 RepID=UPI001C086C7B|nr:MULTISPECIES: flagellar motor switch protein FliG [unclassified Colwellia]MBU2925298.1 flagellar motor switch protein FliG [Colwellia sp. C2M11]MDO6486770.1 flagellar motor switch protein FliG [Colwellia sp. 6_MG-2023]MDO6506956.1 flagellar motor switch protein FliG [Colwellia sp. 5_MG-2023]MDO6556606.1 flagellar motor switch protein FliG [Colwellia sp. 4_MG-2023]MDO6651177.1 flagellar motor switch protein FliG [Colwellia sp. 3_MG-2023]
MSDELNTGGELTATKPSFDISKLEGSEKAAILLLSLSEEDAAQILKHLEPKQVQQVGTVMAAMEDFTQEKITAVHKQFIHDIQNFSTIGFQSEDFVRKALTAALGEDKAGNLIDQIIMGGASKGLDSLKWMDSKQVANIIRNEHPQIQTIVLSYLAPEQSAEIMSQFTDKVRLDLMMRIANLEEVQPAALQELNEIMEKQFAGQAGAQAAKMGGLKAAADIMNYLDTNVEGTLMDSMRENDEEMSQQIQDLMFIFENLADVDDRGMQAILREVEQDALMKAIKGADEALREKFLSNMSKRAAEMLVDDLDAMGPVRISEVEVAQKEILAVARRLSDAGEIMLGGGGGDEFL